MMATNSISFPNGNQAQLVISRAGEKATDILSALGIEQPKALFLIIGGAASLGKGLEPRLRQLFSRGIACAAANCGAMIIDGGTEIGVMRMMGQGVFDRGRKSVLLGVVPSGKVTYPSGPPKGSIEDCAPLDPNHSHFVLVKSDKWGGETETMFELAKVLAEKVPVITLLVNGGDVAREEVLLSVRQGWPVLVIENTARLADELARYVNKKPQFIEDPVIAEIVADGNIHLFPRDGSVEELKRLILYHVRYSRHSTLKLAWEYFARYDQNAIRQQMSFHRFQRWILILGLFASLLALTQTQLISLELLEIDSWQKKALQYAIVIMPITVSLIIAAANRFKAGNKWILLRASAEGIKREIYRYRAKAAVYSDQQAAQISREAQLARKVEAINQHVMQTDVNQSALRPYDGPIPPEMYAATKEDDGISYLDPGRYIEVRLGDQLNYYSNKTNALEKRLKRLQWLIYSFGGAGTLLAAVGLELWVALTTAVAGALVTYLEYQQVENTLTKYNQAATDLGNVKTWWTALSAEEMADQKNIDKLVGHTEKALEGELTGWVQRMEDALAELRANQAREGSEGAKD
jgi:hypothetical protein